MSGPIIEPKRLSHIIGLIYDCVLDVALWPIAMDAIRIELACHNASLDLIELPSGKSLTTATCNISAAYLPLLAGAGPDIIEQWGGEERIRSLPLVEPAVMSQVNPDLATKMEHNRYYQAFARPQGLNDVIALGLARDERAVGTLAFGRHAKAGPIGMREIAIARLLIPHVQRAATINRIIDRETGMRATFAATLDVLTVPIALVNGGRRIIHVNPAFNSLVNQGILVRAVSGRLDAGTPEATQLLATALDRVDKAGLSPRELTISVTPERGNAGALHVVPLPEVTAAGKSGAIATIFVSTATMSLAGTIGTLSPLYQLTPREADVLKYLVEGRSQADVAKQLAIGLSTLKTHLARIYSKLGVSSQAGLVAIAASFAIPIQD